MDKVELCRACSDEAFDTPEGFKEIVTAYVALSDNAQLWLADAFGVSLSTVSRWSRGITCPIPTVRTYIIKQIYIRISEKS